MSSSNVVLLRRRRHPGSVSVFQNGQDQHGRALWLVGHLSYHGDSAGILSTFATEQEADRYADRWRTANPVPEGYADE